MTGAGSDRFKVDLRGVVDLLSHHLYSSPRVFMRELLQNGADAITAGAALGTERPRRILIEAPSAATGGTLRITDTGVGLTASEMEQLLATVGRSSKRDEYSLARAEYLGQFGIGLLSCFMVADEIEVRSLSARTTEAETVTWLGRADGTYEIGRAQEPLASAGTVVSLRPRRDEAEWFDPRTLRELATHFGSMLPVEVMLDDGTGRGLEAVNSSSAPWNASREESHDYCRETFGFEPLAVIPLTVELAGVRGVAFVLPMPTNPAERPSHRVYLKQMLLSDSVEGILPDWAFFVRCVMDTTELRPTASREALFENAVLEQTRVELGRQLRTWLLDIAVSDPRTMAAFLRVHRLGVMAMAAHDDELLGFVADHITFETSLGDVTMAEFRGTFASARYSQTSDGFRAVASIAAAHGYGLVNAGHVYEEELLLRLGDTLPGFSIEPMDSAELAARLDPIPSSDELAARPFLRAAAETLDGRDLDVVLRRFDPASLPTLYLEDSQAARGLIERTALEGATDFWAGLLSAVEPIEVRSTFVLNHANPLIRKLAALGDDPLARDVVGGLYVQALLQGRHPVPASDANLLSSSFIRLIDHALTARPSS